MDLYNLKKNILEPVDRESFKLEKDIQGLIENNVETLFNLEFISTEFTVGDFRLDSLCFDNENNSFVIIEYKKGSSYSVIDQGYSYMSVMLNNKSDFILEYIEKTGKSLKKSEVDFSQSRIIFISPSFNSYQKNSVNFKDMNKFELWEIKRFDNDTIVLNQYQSKSEESIEKIKRKDIINFYKENINSSNASIAIVSSLSKKDIINLSEKISKSLSFSSPKKNGLNNFQKNNKKKYIFKKFNSEQAHIYIGGQSIKRGSKNHLPLYVGNYIFGGSGFSARLMKELRVKRGLTYGVYSYIYPMKNIGPFVVGIETKAEQAQESVRLIHKMLKEFHANGPTDKELTHAKEAIINGFPLRIDSNQDILNYLSMINYYDLPINYLNGEPL